MNVAWDPVKFMGKCTMSISSMVGCVSAKCCRKHMANRHVSSREEVCKHQAWSPSSQRGPFRWAYVMIARPRNPARLIYWSMMMHVWHENIITTISHVYIYLLYNMNKIWTMMYRFTLPGYVLWWCKLQNLLHKSSRITHWAVVAPKIDLLNSKHRESIRKPTIFRVCVKKSVPHATNLQK